MGQLFQGSRSNAKDYEFFSVDSSADLTPSGTGQYIIANGYTIVNYSGAVTVALPSGTEGTTSEFTVLNSPAQSGVTTISGLSTGQTFNGQSTITLSNVNTAITLVNYSGQAWQKIS